MLVTEGSRMIITLEGVQGSGKTLSAVALCYYDAQKGRKVFSNNHLNEKTFGTYTYFDVEYFLEHFADTEMEGATLLLDEAYIYLDARTSGGKLNKLFTYYTVQTRKRGVDMYVCTHHIDVLDKRLRRAVDVRGTCRYIKQDPCRMCNGEGSIKNRKTGGKWARCPQCLGYGETGWAYTDFVRQRTGERSRVTLLGPAFWALYNTKEKIPVTTGQMRLDPRDIAMAH